MFLRIEIKNSPIQIVTIPSQPNQVTFSSNRSKEKTTTNTSCVA